MRKSVFAIALLLALALATHLSAQSESPHMTAVEPGTGMIGDLLTASGENLAAEVVAALYLTDGTKDVRVIIVQQTATSIQFRIPAEARPGRFALLVLTKGKQPKLIEEPVKVTIEPRVVAPTG